MQRLKLSFLQRVPHEGFVDQHASVERFWGRLERTHLHLQSPALHLVHHYAALAHYFLNYVLGTSVVGEVEVDRHGPQQIFHLTPHWEGEETLFRRFCLALLARLHLHQF